MQNDTYMTEEKIRLEKLLHNPNDMYAIYQLKRNEELRPYRFEGTESLKRMGITKYYESVTIPNNYDLIYVGELGAYKERTLPETLERIYAEFNINHPLDFKGHSLSVSDIVVLKQNGKLSAYFVDSFGYNGLPDFTKAIENMELNSVNEKISQPDVNLAQLYPPKKSKGR